MTDLYRTARDWLSAGHRVAAATVTRTWGSAPRGHGAHLFVRDDGLFEGSVSGGCVEGDVVTEAMTALETGMTRRLHYGVADAKAWEAGLACGGEIDILVQPVGGAAFSADLLDRIIAARADGRTLTLYTDEDGRTSANEGDGAFRRLYTPPLELLLVGAVHISQALVPIARTLDYRVRIVDPRGGFAAGERFAGIDVDARWPDEALADWQPGAGSAVVTLTHDPKLDDPALIAALRSEAFYIAALGSRRTHAQRVERLTGAGFDEADIARIHGPAGLDIGAATPAEIALSVAAQMVAAWRARG
ncbi:XdhC family protein [Pacificimonas sp. WHA3]|uniref:XdhC family protein n=1 Tax=Pacificimonas pallii TaxID=2827236 RepID=A0ABS6SGK2_9SPHN|nr:XdhC family protein [Pacificimonas pallii]